MKLDQFGTKEKYVSGEIKIFYVSLSLRRNKNNADATQYKNKKKIGNILNNN